MASRQYTTRRSGIVDALVAKLKLVDGSGDYLTNLEGSESREYQAGGYKDRFLSVTLRCYVQDEDSVLALDGLLEDIETVIEDNSRLAYLDRQGSTHYTQQITIVSIDTDEGVLDPLGVGEMLIEVQYQKMLARTKVHAQAFSR